MTPHSTREVVERFWALMETNDWEAVGRVLAEQFVLEWPQSGERIRGSANFAQMNAHYPAQGAWRFTLRRLVVDGPHAVTEVQVTDGSRADVAISFFTVHDGRVVEMTEYWPETFPAAAWRSAWVERFGKP